MVERYRSTKPELVEVTTKDGSVRERRPPSDPRRMEFTQLGIDRLKPPEKGQVVYWDTGSQAGLSLLVSAGRATKTFRCTYYIDGQAISVKIGRVGAWSLKDARKEAGRIRSNSERQPPIDERAERRKGMVERKKAANNTFGSVVDDFIEQYAKPRQRSWQLTQGILKGGCAPWLKEPMTSISKADAYAVLNAFIARGHPRKAEVTLAWLRTLWQWSWRRDIVPTPLMDQVELHVEKGSRDRFFSDVEIRAIWHAAGSLDAAESAYFKLLILLAPRKTALAALRRSHLDNIDNPTLWTTPHDLTKSRKTATKKRVYLTPLPALAQRILKPLLRGKEGVDTAEALVFPGARKGRPFKPSTELQNRLINAGAPVDFTYHTARHTVATWLENQGHSEWERGLVLNHAGSGVTAGYSHGYPLELKRKLLTEWADHVGSLVTAEGVTLLR